MGQSALVLKHRSVAEKASHARLAGAAIALAVLDGFVALTSAAGAVFVVPTFPNDLYRYHYFYGDTVPAFGLGLVAAIAFTGLYGVLTRRSFGARLSIACGGAVSRR